MKFKIIDKNNVMNMLDSEDLYLLRVGHRQDSVPKIGKYCSSKQVAAMTLREVMNAISDPNVAFIEIKEES